MTQDLARERSGPAESDPELSSRRCPGCGSSLTALQARFVGKSEFNLWAREGYCSYPCFGRSATDELRNRHERIETGRFDRERHATVRPPRGRASRPCDELEIASVFRRFPARLIDALVPRVIVLLALTAWLAAKFGPDATFPLVLSALLGDGVSIAKLAFGLLGGGVLYYSVCDRIGGQTPAKSLWRLRVVTEGGRPVSIVRGLVREAFAVFDGLFAGVVALICTSMSPERQRLGDMIARTVVIRDDRPVLANFGRSLLAALASMAVWVGFMRLLWI